jgi:glycosyltransferase involved in cell wall biosynthesis
MRRGQNPAKFIDHVAKPERVTIAVLSYVPFLSGYHAQSLDVLRVCLGSILRSTEMPCDLLVFDNGSCSEVVDYLLAEQQAGRIQYLWLSGKNLGKGGAWNSIIRGAPGEILAYTDSDAEFSPGWLEASLKILETYPGVGMVTGRPFRTDGELYSNTIRWAEGEPEAEVERGQFIPWEAYRAFDMSLGQGESEVRARFETTEDIRLRYRGVEALVGASHWQFVGWKATLQQFLPFEMDRPMGQVRELDRRVNQAGLLRLMTPEPYVMNLSNTLDEPSEVMAGGRKPPAHTGFGRKALDSRWIKRVLLGIYHRIFRWYYSE